MLDRYTDALCGSISAHRAFFNRTADTLYIGGGTPSALGGNRLGRIITTAKKEFLTKNSEITVEINPADCNEQDFEILASLGVNRLSMGVQSAVEDELKLLSRRHKIADVIETFRLARKVGINNISADLMMGIPNQTKESLKQSVDFLLENSPTHISCYILKVEENTPLKKAIDEGLKLPDDDETAEMYLYLDELLTKNGYEHYEISNFAKKGFESKHNNKYWNCEEYLGLGPSAHSFLDGNRFYFEPDITKFLTNPTPVFDSNGGDSEEYIMLRLRLSKGLNFEEYQRKFGENLSDNFYKKCHFFEKQGLMNFNETSASLTVKGFLVSNSIICELLSE